MPNDQATGSGKRQNWIIFSERLAQAASVHYGRRHGVGSRLSEDLGVAVQTTAKWLRGEGLPAVERWGQIAGLLNVSEAWLFRADSEVPDHLLEAERADPKLKALLEATEIVYPLVRKLAPETHVDEVSSMVCDSAVMLRQGSSALAVQGAIATRLIDLDTME